MYEHELMAAERSRRAGKLATARQALLDLLSTHPQEGAIAAYNLGVICFHDIGDGDSARRYLEDAYDRAGRELGLRAEDRLTLQANAAENMMLLSISFEEYTRWAERLEALQPSNRILRGQVPHVRQAMAAGHAWHAVMTTHVADYLKGRLPGHVASTFQLLLKHRRAMRLPRDAWRLATIGYAGAVMTMISERGVAMEQGRGADRPSEFEFLGELAIPLLEEYLQADPGEPRVAKALDALRQVLTPEPGGGPSLTPEEPQHDPEEAPDKLLLPLMLLGIVAYAAGIWAGIWAGNNLLTFLDRPWGAVGGVLVVLILLEPLRRVLVRDVEGTDQTRQTPLAWHTSPELIAAVRARGFSGLGFHLHRLNIAGGELALHFRPESPVSGGDDREIGLALRSVVALTLPHLIAATPALEVVETADYRIRLGDGVLVQAPALRRGPARTPLLEATSGRDGDTWWVRLRPIQIPGDPTGAGMLGALLHRIYEDLSPGLARLKSEVIRF